MSSITTTLKLGTVRVDHTLPTATAPASFAIAVGQPDVATYATGSSVSVCAKTGKVTIGDTELSLPKSAARVIAAFIEAGTP